MNEGHHPPLSGGQAETQHSHLSQSQAYPTRPLFHSTSSVRAEHQWDQNQGFSCPGRLCFILELWQWPLNFASMDQTRKQSWAYGHQVEPWAWRLKVRAFALAGPLLLYPVHSGGRTLNDFPLYFGPDLKWKFFSSSVSQHWCHINLTGGHIIAEIKAYYLTPWRWLARVCEYLFNGNGVRMTLQGQADCFSPWHTLWRNKEILSCRSVGHLLWGCSTEQDYSIIRNSHKHS